MPAILSFYIARRLLAAVALAYLVIFTLVFLIDFVDLQWWPVFNVADAAICVGAALLVVASLRAPAP